MGARSTKSKRPAKRPVKARTSSRVKAGKPAAKKATKAAPIKVASAPALKLLPDLVPDFRARLARLDAALESRGVPHALITNPLDVGYFTGFLGGDSYLLVGTGGPVIISDFRYEEELAPVASLAKVHIRKGAIIGAVADVAGQLGVTELGVQAETVTLAQSSQLSEALGEGKTLRPLARLVQPFRLIKDDSEVRLIQNAARIQEAALREVLPTIRVGETELEIASRLEAAMKARGSPKPGFESIVAARANGSLPHYRPQKVKTAANTPLLIDWGATYKGYHSDMTRTFALGKWPAKVREIYEIVREAHMAAAAALKPGVSSRDVDSVARTIITDAGYGPNFGHGLGHGLGLQGHDEPFLSHMAPPTELAAGMVVTIEPGIYLPGIGGVRLEDDYLITATGAKNLCTMPLDVEWATL
ncbi:MAG: Xaa-Pro peptidase family protein [Phycisphaerales bacterium]|jgi:Xaa-Pro aminopeptidase